MPHSFRRRSPYVPYDPFAFIVLATCCLLLPSLAASASAQEEAGRTDKPESAKEVQLQSVLSLDSADIDRIVADKRRKSADEFTDLERAVVFEGETFGGVDFAVAGTQTRNAGYGTIRLRGVPARASLVLAFLYWGEVVAAPVPATADVNFEGRRISGDLIGTSTQPCWNSSGVFALYRANVSLFIPAEIDGDYQVDGFNSFLVDGRDPWAFTPTPGINTLPLAEGASLVVFFIDAETPAGARVYLHHGPAFFSGLVDFTHTLSPALPAHLFLRHARIGADGQHGAGRAATATLSDERTFIGPTTAALVQIRGTGSAINTDSDWNGADGRPINQLWDTNDDDLSTRAVLAAGDTSYVVRYQSFGDCIEAAVHILGVR